MEVTIRDAYTIWVVVMPTFSSLGFPLWVTNLRGVYTNEHPVAPASRIFCR
jgi:hypothetical protein